MEISKDDLAKMIDAAVKSAGKKPKREKPSPEVTAKRKSDNDAECVRVFEAAGYDDVQPRVNVLTYGKVKPDGTITGWLAKGRRVRKGEKALQVGPFQLFHESQTDPIEADGTIH